MNTKFIFTGLFFLFILISGFILSRAGRPLNVLLLTVHKLISVGAVVFLAITVFKINQVSPLSPIEITASIVTLVLFVAMVATGGLLSTSKTMPVLVLKAHQIMPYLAILSTTATLYLVLIRKV